MAVAQNRKWVIRPVYLVTTLYLWSAGSLGIWLSAFLATEFRLTGTTNQQFKALVVIFAIVGTSALTIALPVILVAFFKTMRNLLQSANEEPGAWPHSDWEFFDPIAKKFYFIILIRGFFTGGTALASTIGLWVFGWLFDALDIPVHIPQGWSILVVFFITAACFDAACRIMNPVTPRPVVNAFVTLSDYALCFGAFWCAVTVLNGVRVESGDDRTWLLSMVSFVIIFKLTRVEWSAYSSDFSIIFSIIAAIAAIIPTALTLFVLSWFSRWMEPSFHITGFWTFVLISTIMAAAAIPGYLARTFELEY